MRDLKMMFVSHEWDDLSFSHKPEGEAICRLVSYQESFWVGVEEVVSISEPLVKVLWLMETNPQWAICMRPWIGPKKPSVPIMMTREMMDFRNDYRYGE
jgi:hypothetical protein